MTPSFLFLGLPANCLMFRGSETGPENLAIPVVRLAPPINPLPEVTAQIRKLERGREELEQKKLARLHDAYQDALASASERIRAITTKLGRRGGSAFLENQIDEPQVIVKLAKSQSDLSQEAKNALDELEAARSVSESKLFDQAIAELGELSHIATSLFEEEVQNHVKMTRTLGAFLQTYIGLPKQVNVRVGSSSVFPTIADLAELAEAKRDTSEAQVRQEILRLEAQLLKEINSLAKESLEGSL